MIINSRTIIGAIAGDVIGSTYEGSPHKVDYDFDLFNGYKVFTDDTVLTIAIADALLHNKPFKDTLLQWARRYPNAGYGRGFKNWFSSDQPEPYNSYGNGAAMRVSPIGFAFNDMDTVLAKAKESAEVSHNHPEGIKGAQAVAGAVFLAKTGHSKEDIRDFIVKKIGYNLDFTIDAIRPFYRASSAAFASVPQAIVCFLESLDFESAIRKAIYLGGDTDTIADIAGAIAAAYYKEIPQDIMNLLEDILPGEFKEIINEFEQKLSENYWA